MKIFESFGLKLVGDFDSKCDGRGMQIWTRVDRAYTFCTDYYFKTVRSWH